MISRTLEQQRALYALQTIQRHRQEPDEQKGRYATLVRSVPSMVLQNGLGQALAYLLADSEGKRDKPAYQLYAELENWLCDPGSEERPERVYQNGQILIEALMSGTRFDYQRAQQSALALLAWMRKFADAYLPKVER